MFKILKESWFWYTSITSYIGFWWNINIKVQEQTNILEVALFVVITYLIVLVPVYLVGLPLWYLLGCNKEKENEKTSKNC